MGKIIRPAGFPLQALFILQTSYALNSCFKTLKFDIKSQKKGGNMKKLTFILLGCISALMISSQSFAETTMSQEGQYIFNSLGFCIGEY